MLAKFLLVSLANYAAVQGQQLTLAKSYTSWDCCKPVCATANNNNQLLNSRGVAAVCDRNNNPLGRTQGISSTSGCSNNGNGFLCSSYQPIPVEERLSYGFAIQVGGNAAGDNQNCCRCYEVEWVSGAASDKKMVVQVVNIATQPTGNSQSQIRNNDLIILTPGGGVGPYNTGCRSQYGTSFNNAWGNDYGGVNSSQACGNLPTNLQGGCYWRFNWGRGEINGWDIVYKRVTCPDRLREISGCAAAAS